MADIEILLEAERRGILPDDKKELLQEARKRGLIPRVIGKESEEKAAPTPSLPQRAYQTALAGASGFNVGASNVLGMPVDILNKFLSLIPGGGSKEPVLGSEWIKRNVMPTGVQPQGLAQNIAYGVGQQIPNAMSMALMPGGVKAGEMAKYAIGAGTGGGIAKTIAPESPYAELAGELVGGAGVPAIKSGISALSRTSIRTGIEKGIRPSVVGKSTSPLYEKYMNKAENAVRTIYDNKPNLVLTDELGNTVQGELPKTLKQFTQAIDQSKRSVFAQYDAMTQQTGKRWVVDLDPISKELNDIAGNKIIRTYAPETANYADKLATKLRMESQYTGQEAQEALSVLNTNLEAFYKNPDYSGARKAYIDSMIANRLREDLDRVVEKTVAPGYQELKNKYGALKAIEKEVTQRSIVDARKNVKGLIDFSDVFTGYHAARGIIGLVEGGTHVATGGASLGASLIAKTIAHLWKSRNDPNRIISNMFETIEKSHSAELSALEKVGLPSAINVYEKTEKKSYNMP